MTFQIGIFRPALIIGIISLLLALLENFKIHSNSRFCMGKKWERAVSGHVLVNYVRGKVYLLFLLLLLIAPSHDISPCYCTTV